MTSRGEREGDGTGGEREEQKGKLLSEALTPQLDTERAAFRLTSGQICGYSSRRNPKLVCTVRILQHNRGPLLNVLSLWCV